MYTTLAALKTAEEVFFFFYNGFLVNVFQNRGYKLKHPKDCQG